MYEDNSIKVLPAEPEDCGVDQKFTIDKVLRNVFEQIWSAADPLCSLHSLKVLLLKAWCQIPQRTLGSLVEFMFHWVEAVGKIHWNNNTLERDGQNVLAYQCISGEFVSNYGHKYATPETKSSRSILEDQRQGVHLCQSMQSLYLYVLNK